MICFAQAIRDEKRRKEEFERAWLEQKKRASEQDRARAREVSGKPHNMMISHGLGF